MRAANSLENTDGEQREYEALRVLGNFSASLYLSILGNVVLCYVIAYNVTDTSKTEQ